MSSPYWRPAAQRHDRDPPRRRGVDRHLIVAGALSALPWMVPGARTLPRAADQRLLTLISGRRRWSLAGHSANRRTEAGECRPAGFHMAAMPNLYSTGHRPLLD